MARHATGPTPERLALAERVRDLRDEGLLQREIAEQLRLSRSYTQELLEDPDGAKTRARKDSYQGTCVVCGGPTSGSGGRQVVPERCADCAAAENHARKTWTEETVIDAIRRFAAIHGRPPTSAEWIASDPANGYPPRASVYGRHSSNPSSPFVRWADAIEAAGFPRPSSGRRTQKETLMAHRIGYIILRETTAGVWELVAERDEYSPLLALNAALNGSPPEGRWVAVAAKSWRPRTLKPRTIYDFVEEPTA